MALLLTVRSVSGTEWDFTKGIDLQTVYSDNPNFDPRSEAVSDTIAKVKSFFNLKSTGKRINSNLSLGVEYLSFPRLDEEQLNTRINSNVITEFIPDTFFSTAFLNFNQSNVSNNSLFDDPLTLSDETNNRLSGGANLYIEKKLSGSKRFLVNYGFGALENSSSTEQDSINHSLDLNWQQVLSNQKTAWEIGAKSQRTEIQEIDASFEISTATGRLVHILNRSVRVSARIGIENNSSSLDESSTSSEIWDVDLEWEPNARNAFTVTYGERAFGKSPELQYQYLGRRLTVNASWNRNYADTNIINLNSDAFGFENDNQSQSNLEIGTTIINEAEHPLLNGFSLVDDTISLDLSLRGRVTDISAGGRYIRRKNSQESTQIEGLFLRTAVTRNISERTRWELSYEYQEEIADENSSSIYNNRVALAIKFSL